MTSFKHYLTCRIYRDS